MKIIITFLSFVFLLSISGQEKLFTVIISQGDNKISLSNDDSKTIQPSDELYEGQKLILENNSYIVLLHKSGKTLELTEPNIYNLNALSSKVASYNRTILSNITEYIKNEILPPSAREDTIPGAVERSSEEIKVYYPIKASRLLDSLVLFKWEELDNVDKYKFKIFDSFDNIFYEKITEKSELKVNVDKLQLHKDDLYFWSVSLPESASVGSGEIHFYRLSDDQITCLQDTIQMLKSNLDTALQSAFGNILLASLYERNYVIDEAVRYYSSALRMRPNIIDYQKRYKRFLYKNGITRTKENYIKQNILKSF